jgi:hypothetical protein
VPFPVEWDGGSARIVRLAARLTTTGSATWLPSGSSFSDTGSDPGATGSVLAAATSAGITDDVTGSGMTADGSPTASAYLAFLAAISDGDQLTAATFVSPSISVTGHGDFLVSEAPAGSTWVQFVVSLDPTPPTITDSAGFTWTQVSQTQFGAGWLTMWTAPIDTTVNAPGVTVALSETCDSGIGRALDGQQP